MMNESEESLASLVRNSKVIAVIGMKDDSDPMAPAFGVPAHLGQLGYDIWPVNPKIESALGRPAVPDIASLPVVPDLVNVFRRKEALPGIADEILSLPPGRRPGAVWFQTGIADDAVATRLREHGITVVQDRCLGVYASRYRRQAVD